MIVAGDLKNAFTKIAEAMSRNVDLLTKLDSESGDGDLGISMKQGFGAIAEAMKGESGADVGKTLMKASMVLNEESPSTLGTILSTGLLVGGKTLKGKTVCSLDEIANALEAAIEAIMKRSQAKEGEKTILDALIPVQQSLKQSALENLTTTEAALKAAQAASDGCESTKRMTAVHGRAAYYAQSSIGRIDGGAEAAKIIFTALAGGE
ncbi:MAG: dihydroxyacetone kinase subunit L [Clostridiales bacterium]|nr:dihydroxyacetone kinase subunit L [Clostridiales bacterium]